MNDHNDTSELVSAVVQGTLLEAMPVDLYIPPDALRVFLKTFEGPLDLLLYLIQRQNLNILDIPIAEITRQYLQYIDLMKEFHLDLAAEYLVMSAVLTEIKSRLLLPVHENDNELQNDPRARLVRQLQEYARYKKAARALATLPQVDRDVFLTHVELPELPREIIIPSIPLTAMLAVMRDVMTRATLFSSHQVRREPLSVRERMTLILERLKTVTSVDFVSLFTVTEGRAGVVVTFLATLELAKESLIQIVQSQTFSTIQVSKADVGR